jgi:hypothetical protein
MEVAGWIVETKTGLVFPNFFEEFNSDPTDKSRTNNAERQRRYRNAKRNVTSNVTVTHREEKSRVEDNSNKAAPCTPTNGTPLNEPKRFIPPNIEDVVAYCRERANNVDAQKFLDFYESKAWMVGKNKMRDWRASVRTWEKTSTVSSVKAHDPRGNMAVLDAYLKKHGDESNV